MFFFFRKRIDVVSFLNSFGIKTDFNEMTLKWEEAFFALGRAPAMWCNFLMKKLSAMIFLWAKNSAKMPVLPTTGLTLDSWWYGSAHCHSWENKNTFKYPNVFINIYTNCGYPVMLKNSHDMAQVKTMIAMYVYI